MMNINNSLWSKIGIRGVMIIFWVVVCWGFLVLPDYIYQNYIARYQKSITVFAWPAIIDTQYLQKFEQEAGIKVYVRYFETNEELLTKMQLTQGKGYDLIMPSEYMVQEMANQGLLKTIDRSKLPFFNEFYPHLINNYYDTNNDYSIPFFWNMYGIAIDRDFFGMQKIDSSWSLIFADNGGKYRVSMPDDARVLALLAGKYLYGTALKTESVDVAQVTALLREQKKWVEVYTDDRANFLLASKTCPVALISNAIVSRITPIFKNIEFIIPQEGSFLSIDVFALPKTTEKDDLVYEFLNFMFKQSTLQHHTKKYGYFSPLKNGVNDQGTVALPTDEQMAKAQIFKNVLTKQQLSDMLIALKA